MSYIDGFVCAVPTNRQAEYAEHADKAAHVFKQYGAIEVIEAWGDDVPDGTHTSFLQAVKCAENETVVFSWVKWPSKAARDEGMAKFMQDPICDLQQNPLPFDGKRLIYGSFKAIIER
ncbi:DUF1428 domain-containing protein [Pseudoalteromonas arctica]|uniref:DUF1428 domain-containing protein n=1 Tax=Pseudoalteromonas arctica TaxID=394751 RepID=A0A7Y0DQG0_9GAMM|nr:DUF1428 domain-containing protein [Pseudoalteromonas arctica]NMM39718.1 DUF1428 domain-containing protein [Pseudoalteromonas arctica]